MCQCNNTNCGCTPEEYTSGIVYDGLKFNCPQLAGIKPNCNNLNDLLELWGTILCGLLENTLILNIGAWDMDTLGTLAVAHGLSAQEFASIKGIQVLIDDDGVTTKLPLDTNIGAAFNGFFSADATNINLDRVVGGVFDAVGYSGAVANRGYIIINYTKD